MGYYLESFNSGLRGINSARTLQTFFFDQTGGLTLVSTIGVQGTGNSYFGGNVGIGITAPLGRLDVQGATARTGTAPTTPSFYVTGTLTDGRSGPQAGNIEFRHDNQSQGIGFGYNTIYQTGYNTNQDLNLLSRGSSPLTLNAYSYSTGNVGVGTTNPAARFSVLGNGIGSALIGANGCGGNYTGISLSSNVDTGCGNGYNLLSSPTDLNLYINRPTGYSINFRENNSDQMYIKTGGNVGIGTTGPTAKLQVSGYTSLGGNQPVAPGDQGGNAAVIGSDELFSNAKGLLRVLTTDAFAIDKGGSIVFGGKWSSTAGADAYGNWAGIKGAKENATDGDYGGYLSLGTRLMGQAITERIRITSAGNVGIGTTGPGAPLDVQAASPGGPATLAQFKASSGVDNGAYVQVGSNNGFGSLALGGSGGSARIVNTTGGWQWNTQLNIMGSAGIGTASPNAAASLDIVSTTKGFLPPRMTTAQRNAITAPPAGLSIYNTSTNQLNFYNGTGWQAVTAISAQISFDASASLGNQTTSPVSFSITTAGGNETVLVAIMAANGGVPTATLDGSAMTAVQNVVAGSGGYLSLLQSVAATAGAHTINCTVASSNRWSATAIALQMVNTTTPVDVSVGNTASQTATVTTTGGNEFIIVAGGYESNMVGTSINWDAAVTKRTDSSGYADVSIGTLPAIAAGAYTDSWTAGSGISSTVATIMVAVKQ